MFRCAPLYAGTESRVVMRLLAVKFIHRLLLRLSVAAPAASQLHSLPSLWPTEPACQLLSGRILETNLTTEADSETRFKVRLSSEGLFNTPVCLHLSAALFVPHLHHFGPEIKILWIIRRAAAPRSIFSPHTCVRHSFLSCV